MSNIAGTGTYFHVIRDTTRVIGYIYLLFRTYAYNTIPRFITIKTNDDFVHNII